MMGFSFLLENNSINLFQKAYYKKEALVLDAENELWCGSNRSNVTFLRLLYVYTGN